jgi:hypothetical protein
MCAPRASTRAAGMHSVTYKLRADVSEAELLALVAALNADPSIHGILVQLPLPPALDETSVIDELDASAPERVSRHGCWILPRLLNARCVQEANQGREGRRTRRRLF